MTNGYTEGTLKEVMADDKSALIDVNGVGRVVALEFTHLGTRDEIDGTLDGDLDELEVDEPDEIKELADMADELGIDDEYGDFDNQIDDLEDDAI